MKYSFHKKNIFIIFILILLIKISSGNEQKQLERYTNTIELILSRCFGTIENTSLVFQYEKYNISINNLRILKPFNKDLNITKEINNTNEIYFKTLGLNATIQGDILIYLFPKRQEIIEYKSIFFEIYFDNIKFKIINNFHIEFASLNIESIIYNNIDNLDYFSDFNNKKSCFLYEEGKDAILLKDYDSTLKKIFKNKFEEKIKKKENIFNLLTYDVIQLFDNYEFNKTYNGSDESKQITSLATKKLKVDEDNININFENNSLSLKSFHLKGIYEYVIKYQDYFSFDINCTKNKNKEYFKFEKNENDNKMEFILSDCLITDDNKNEGGESINYNEEIKTYIQKYYIDYLKQSAEKYYNDIFG